MERETKQEIGGWGAGSGAGAGAEAGTYEKTLRILGLKYAPDTPQG